MLTRWCHAGRIKKVSSLISNLLLINSTTNWLFVGVICYLPVIAWIFFLNLLMIGSTEVWIRINLRFKLKQLCVEVKNCVIKKIFYFFKQVYFKFAAKPLLLMFQIQLSFKVEQGLCGKFWVGYGLWNEGWWYSGRVFGVKILRCSRVSTVGIVAIDLKIWFETPNFMSQINLILAWIFQNKSNFMASELA